MKLYGVLLIAAFGGILSAQDFQPNQISVGGGGSFALGSYAPFDTGTAAGVNFGYRFSRYFQADFGAQAAFN